MKKVISKGRLLLRRILAVLSFGTISVLFQSCPISRIIDSPVAYGMPPQTNVTGTVKAADTEAPIPGIQVSDNYGSHDPIITDENGQFEFLLFGSGGTVLVKDIDGPLNGEFQDKEVPWKEGDLPLDITLEPKTIDVQ